ncbi:MAG TPA: AfsR/SARP family transcriptional regulator [Pilimelia sp.]|nr:AfsR/SARP family transcriptional regulator [Pilimelia sp.]
MYFRLLGPLEAEVNGSTLQVDGAKQRAVLCALLAAANDLVPLGRLIDWSWPRRPPKAATAVVQAHISRLRRAIEPHRAAWSRPCVLIFRAPGYVLRVQPDQLDMLVFEGLVADGRSALERDDPERAAALLGRALSLWRGSPLADVAHIEAAQATIARLEALRLSAIVARIDADLALGRDAALVPELEGLVRAHPFDERLCAQLMIALYRCGRQAQSLEAYARMREVLARELKIAPAPASRRLQEAILAHDPGLESRAVTSR